MGSTTSAAWATYWPGASEPFAKPMNEIHEGRVLGLARVR